MPSTETKNGAPSIDAALEQVKELNEQFLGVARKAGNIYLDAYETSVDRGLELEVKLAGLTQQEWLRNVIEAQTELAREVVTSYTAAARSALK